MSIEDSMLQLDYFGTNIVSSSDESIPPPVPNNNLPRPHASEKVNM
jgi:hypothetical protein